MFSGRGVMSALKRSEVQLAKRGIECTVRLANEWIGGDVHVETWHANKVVVCMFCCTYS